MTLNLKRFTTLKKKTGHFAQKSWKTSVVYSLNGIYFQKNSDTFNVFDIIVYINQLFTKKDKKSYKMNNGL